MLSHQFTIALIGAIMMVIIDAAVVAPVPASPVPLETLEEIDVRPQYKYGYDVDDTLSGDTKGHIEERDGDVVRGEYSLIDPDGFRRIVTYTADSVNGFNAVVRREPLVLAPAAVPATPAVVEPLIKAAPLFAAAPAPAPVPVPARLAGIRAAPLVRPVAAPALPYHRRF